MVYRSIIYSERVIETCISDSVEVTDTTSTVISAVIADTIDYGIIVFQYTWSDIWSNCLLRSDIDYEMYAKVKDINIILYRIV